MSQIDLSVVFQRNLERLLSGLALAHPLEGIEAFKRVNSYLLDEISITFLKALWRREAEILRIKPDSRVHLAIAIACDVNPVAVLDGLNKTGGDSEYEEFPYTDIFSDLEQRISDQVILRRGLPDLAQFVDLYMGNRYASR